jgi:hypothetical protein
VEPDKVKTALAELLQTVSQSHLALLFSLRSDFPNEWAAFVNNTDLTAPFSAAIRRDFFPYFTRGKAIAINGYSLCGVEDTNQLRSHGLGDQATWDGATRDLADVNKLAFSVTVPPDPAGPTQILTHTPIAHPYLIVQYSLSS